MRSKHLVVDVTDHSFPEFRFWGNPRSFYVFRRVSPRGLFDYVKYQRDGKAGAISVDLATTYDPNWDLYLTVSIGQDTSLVAVKKGTWVYDVREEWHIYGNDKHRFQAVLTEVGKDLAKYGLKFFHEAAGTLESDQLLQHGLELVREWGSLSESGLADLRSDIEAAHHKSWDLKNERLNQLKQNLRHFASEIGAPREKRRAISAMAMQLVFLQPDKKKCK